MVNHTMMNMRLNFRLLYISYERIQICQICIQQVLKPHIFNYFMVIQAARCVTFGSLLAISMSLMFSR